MPRKGSISEALEEVGFPGIPEDQQIESAPITAELGKDKKKTDEIFDRTDLKYAVKLRVFNGDDTQDADDWGELTGKFMNVKMPEKVGDAPAYIRLKQETTFTKDGTYVIAVQWAECTRIGVPNPDFNEEPKNDKSA